MTDGSSGRPPPGPPDPTDDRRSLDGTDHELLDVIYDIAMTSLDRVVTLSQADFLS